MTFTLDELRKFRQVLVSFTLLLLFLAAGEVASHYLKRAGFPIPGNVIGMVLLTAALLAGAVKLEWVEPGADVLLSELGLFFVPPGVGVMLYFDLIAREWLPLLAGTLGSIVAVLWATAIVARLLEKREVAHHGE